MGTKWTLNPHCWRLIWYDTLFVGAMFLTFPLFNTFTPSFCWKQLPATAKNNSTKVMRGKQKWEVLYPPENWENTVEWVLFRHEKSAPAYLTDLISISELMYIVYVEELGVSAHLLDTKLGCSHLPSPVPMATTWPVMLADLDLFFLFSAHLYSGFLLFSVNSEIETTKLPEYTRLQFSDVIICLQILQIKFSPFTYVLHMINICWYFKMCAFFLFFSY